MEETYQCPTCLNHIDHPCGPCSDCVSKQKHFSFESQNPVISVLPTNMENAEILDVSFLTPAKINFTVKGKTQQQMVHIDLIEKAAYLPDGEKVAYSDKIFAYLNSINELDPDFFGPSEDIYNQQEQIMKEHDIIRKEATDG